MTKLPYYDTQSHKEPEAYVADDPFIKAHLLLSTCHVNNETDVVNDGTLVLPLLVQHGYSQKSGDGISILGSSSFRDDIGYYHVVGEVMNNSPKDSMNFVRITSTFYDDTGKVLDTDFTYSNVDVLPEETSPFEIILTDATQSQKVSNYKLAASGDKTEALPASLKLSLGDNHLDDIGYYHIAGEVTNQGCLVLFTIAVKQS